MGEIAVIGIGNPFRGDDGAGWAVIDELKGQISNPMHLFKVRGDIAILLDYFEKYPTLYLVDACMSDGKVGSWQRIDLFRQPLELEKAQTSTHGLNISQAISLGQALGQLPDKMIIYAINGDQFNISNKISPPVQKAVKDVTNQLLNELN